MAEIVQNDKKKKDTLGIIGIVNEKETKLQ